MRSLSSWGACAVAASASAAVMKDFYRTSEFCAACHKAAPPNELNGYNWQSAISHYDEWQNLSFAKIGFFTLPCLIEVAHCGIHSCDSR